MEHPIYEPQEDSYLLQEQVAKFAYGKVLDVGTGSGIQALTAIKSNKVKQVLAIDINEQAIFNLKQKKVTRLTAKVSNLFSNVSGKFDTIIFNPPYLPQDEKIVDPALYGGKKGWEVSERFFKQAANFLNKDGQILFLFSSYTNKPKIEQIITDSLLEFEQLSAKTFAFFEELYVYKITKTKLLRDLESKHINSLSFLAKGKRGLVYSGKLRSKKVAIKTMNPRSTAIGRIDNEAKWLILLNKHQIGPKFYFAGQDYLVMGFVEGERIDEWIERQHSKNKSKIVNLLLDCLKQCYVMDQLKVNKEEMHHPHKHILVCAKNKKALIPVMIDFERCHLTSKPTNVTQFLEFICRIHKELSSKGLYFDVNLIRNFGKEYREDEAYFKKIIGYFSSLNS